MMVRKTLMRLFPWASMALLLGLVGFFSPGQAEEGLSQAVKPEVGSLAPDFAPPGSEREGCPALRVSGQTTGLLELLGHLVPLLPV